jgi:hypothetical protein
VRIATNRTLNIGECPALVGNEVWRTQRIVDSVDGGSSVVVVTIPKATNLLLGGTARQTNSGGLPFSSRLYLRFGAAQ